MDILTIIVLTLFLSLLYNLALKKFNVSPIVGYIFTGVSISYFIAQSHISEEYLSHIAEFGIVFLMFTIGLEFSVKHLIDMKKEVFVFGSLQVILSSVLFTLISHYLFALDLKTSIVIGSALALSSTAIVLKVLNDNGDIHRPYGRNSVGILIFQDIAVIPILLMIAILSDADTSISSLLLHTFLSAIFVGVVLYILGKYVLSRYLEYVVQTKVEELFIASVLFIVLASALFAHSQGFSYSLGAFLAGMLIAETKFKHQIEADLIPFRDLLLGVFFITVGMQVNLQTLYENFFLIVALAVVILSLKVVIIFVILKFFTFTKRAIKTALTLAQVGEFSFAIFALASANGLIESQLTEIMIPVVIISLLFTSLVLRYVRAFVDFFDKEPSEVLSTPIQSAGMSNHIIVCGYSLLGQKIVKELKDSQLPYVGIEHNAQHLKLAQEKDDNIYFGNAASKIMLNSLDIKNAVAVVIAIDNDEKIRLICENIRSIDENIRIVLKITHQAQLEEFEDLHINKIINENKLVASELVKKAISCQL